MDECIPKSVPPLKRRNCPWLTKQLIQAFCKRNALFKRAKPFGDFFKYNRLLGQTVSQLRLAKKAFFQKINPKWPKEFWKACKLLCKSSNSSIPVLISDSIITQSSTEKAELFNTYFTSCYNTSYAPLNTPMASSHPTLIHSQRTFLAMSNLSMSPWLHSMSPTPVIQTVSLHTCSSTLQ